MSAYQVNKVLEQPTLRGGGLRGGVYEGERRTVLVGREYGGSIIIVRSNVLNILYKCVYFVEMCVMCESLNNLFSPVC